MIHEWKYFLVDETKTMASSMEEVFKCFGALVGKSIASRVAFFFFFLNWMLTLHLTYLLRFVQIVQIFILCCFVVVIQLDMKRKGAIFFLINDAILMTIYAPGNSRGAWAQAVTLRVTKRLSSTLCENKEKSNVIQLAWCNGFLNAFISLSLSSVRFKKKKNRWISEVNVKQC